ncbi:hypothetical protein HRbin28_00341 [bacterium HR28]|nr:hypothetical protein HRbin28_00341 [bacterium HR28]
MVSLGSLLREQTLLGNEAVHLTHHCVSQHGPLREIYAGAWPFEEKTGEGQQKYSGRDARAI